MASRENQGLQAMLIVAVMGMVLMAILTYFFYRRSDEMTKLSAERQQKLSTTESALKQAELDLNGMATMMNGDGGTVGDIALTGAQALAVKAEYDKLMQDFGAGLGEPSNRNLSKLLAHLINELQTKNKIGAERTAGENTLIQKNNELKAATDAEVLAFKKAQEQTAQDLAARTTEFAEQLKEKDSNAAVLQESVAKAQQEADEAKAAADKTVQDALKRMSELEALNRKLLAELESCRAAPKAFRNQAAQITWVNQRAGTVWINIGSKDGLQRQTTFSVYDKEVSGIEESESKGSIEVTRIEENRAEARITKDFVAAPFVVGDIIYSAAWRPGRQSAFAFAGVLDVDGSGKEDRGEAEIVRNLVRTFGGLVHAEIGPDGSVAGQVQSGTTYVVLGIEPTDTALQASYRTIRDQGKQFGITEITLDDFLSLTGYQGQVRAVQLGPGADPADFKIRSKEPSRPMKLDKNAPPAPLFRPRKPLGKSKDKTKTTESVTPKRGENEAFE